MNVKPYDKLSEVYNGLMKRVDYYNWSNYILEIAEENIENGANILELASGNCKMAEIISKKYKNYIATDISRSMLKSANENKINKICCSMTDLPLKTKFQFIFSAFDSVNYILSKKLVLKFFNEIYLRLSDKGIFTFDASLENNSLKFLVEKKSQEFYRFLENVTDFNHVRIYTRVRMVEYEIGHVLVTIANGKMPGKIKTYTDM